MGDDRTLPDPYRDGEHPGGSDVGSGGQSRRVDRERRRRDVSAAAVIREAVAAYFAQPAAPKRYSFIGIADSGSGEAIGRNAEEILEREFADWIEESSGLRERRRVRDAAADARGAVTEPEPVGDAGDR